jgi:hypothetical protein
MRTVGINKLTVGLTEPDTVRLMPTLFASEGGIITRPTWRGSRDVSRDTNIDTFVVAWRRPDRWAFA